MSAPLRVLILEDRAADAALMLAELRRAGFDLDWERVDTEAEFDAHLDPHLDVILADYSLPQFNALRALRLLQESGMDVPLIVVTGAIGDEAAAECMRMGATDYVLKDRLARLGQAVARTLEPRQLRVEKLGLTSELQQRTSELEALHRIGMAANASLDLDDLLAACLTEVAEATQADAAALSLLEEGGQQLRIASSVGMSAELVDAEEVHDLECLCGWCVRHREGATVSDIDADERMTHQACRLAGYYAYSAAPLVKDDRTLGVLSVHARRVGTFGEATLRFLREAAALLALAVEDARLHAETRAALENERRLARIARAISADLDLNALLPRIVQLAAELVGADAGAMALLTPDGETLAYAYLFNLPDELANQPAPKGEGLAWHTIDTGESVLVSDYGSLPTARPQWVEAGVRGIVAAPLAAGDERIGVLGLFHLDSGSSFSERDRELAVSVGCLAGVAIQNAQLHASVMAHATELEKRVAERTHELAEANMRLLELDQLKSKFVSDVSHELRTPVSNLSLYVGLLERGKPERRDHHIGVLKEQTARLSALIEDILNLSRLDLGGKKVAFGEVDLNGVVEQVVAAHGPRAEASELALAFEPGPGLPLVLGERNQLALVVSNLVDNAISFTPAGEVRLSTGLADGEVQLEVRDTGTGIHAEDMDHLFERFYRGRYATELDVPGNGLGLAIVKEIVDIHGGRVEVDSEVGAGSTFRVWLPVVEGVVA